MRSSAKLVESLFRAMQAGPGGEEAMVRLFTDERGVHRAVFGPTADARRPGGDSAEFPRSVGTIHRQI